MPLEAYGAQGGAFASIEEVDFSEMDACLARDRALALDVRRLSEFNEGAAPGAQNVAHTRLLPRLNEIPKGRQLLVYCRSGARSYHACNFLGQQGIDNVINLRGGIIAWARQGYEIAAPQQQRASNM